MIPKYKQLQIQIEEKQISLNEDRKRLKEICPHSEVKFKSWCSDDYAFENNHDCFSYSCDFCGKNASTMGKYTKYKEENELTFLQLQDKYNRQQRKKSPMWVDRDCKI